MSATSAQAIIQGAFDLIGVTQAGSVPSGNDIQDSYRRLQNMVGSLAIQSETIPTVGREVFTLSANLGSYTIGPGGNFNTSRPNSLSGAGLLMPGSPNPVEIPRALLTDDGWEAIQIKDLSNSLFTAVYYNATFQGGLGTINLWPIPNTGANSLVIYRDEQLGQFQSLTAVYWMPNGYDEMFEYNLAVRLAGPYRMPLPPYVQQMAVESLGLVKRANYKITDVPVDPALAIRRRYGYNINTGNL